MIGANSMVTRADLRYTRDYLTPGICSLIKPTAMENWCHFAPKSTQSCCNSRVVQLGKQYTKITLSRTHTQFATRVHALFHFLHDITNPWITIKTTISAHRLRVSLARFVFCWWRHHRLLMTSQWPDNCDQSMWKFIPISLGMNLITVIFTAGRVRKR